MSTMIARIGSKHPARLYLAEWREFRRLSQEQLANRIGSTKSSISRWENAERDITTKALSAIADALDISVSDLYRDPERPSLDALLRDASDDIRSQAIKIISVLKAAS